MAELNAGEGLIFAMLLDGSGGGRELDWQGIRAWRPDDGPLWVHLNRASASSEAWLRDEAGLSALQCDAMLADESRPRLFSENETLLLILRGVNLNPGANPQDMIAVRVHCSVHRMISVRRRTVMSAQDLRKDILAGRGPTSAAELLVALADRLLDRIGPVIDSLESDLSRLESEADPKGAATQRAELGELRREAIGLRRYLAPQRDVLSRLQVERLRWLDHDHRASLRETGDRLLRYVEDLDAAREQALVTRDELSSRLAEEMNKTMYVMSLVAAIFLPLGLLTGLLGINVGGLPGTESSWAFAVVCLILVILAVLEWRFLRRRGLL